MKVFTFIFSVLNVRGRCPESREVTNRYITSQYRVAMKTSYGGWVEGLLTSLSYWKAVVGRGSLPICLLLRRHKQSALTHISEECYSNGRCHCTLTNLNID